MNENSSPKHKPLATNIKNAKGEYAIKPPRKITQKYLYNAGLAYLQRFPTSTANFHRVMMKKIKKSCAFYEDQSIEECLKLLDEVTQSFTRMGLLDDDAYLKGMITSLRKRGKSKQAILAKLQQKGMDTSEILDSLKNFEDKNQTTQSHDFLAALELTRRKKLGAFRIKETFDANKELAALARAGFGFDIATKALKIDKDTAQEYLLEISL